jgi:hypothetical protein
MESLGGYLATIVVSLIGGYLAQFLTPKSKLLCWSPHNFIFNLQQEKVVLQSNAITVQNVGRLPAVNIEIIHQQKPDFFELFPAVQYQESINSNGEHVIKISSLGPKEWLMVQLLSYKTTPNLKNVRWEYGQAKWVQIQPQRVWPKWLLIVANVLFLVGLGTLIYLLIILGIHLKEFL